jgi:cytosine deaminase
MDMLEVWREGVRILHLDYPYADWADAVAAAPARALRVDPPRLAAGEAADFILTQARDFTELFSRPQADRVVIRNGVSLDATAPRYAELDALKGLSP